MDRTINPGDCIVVSDEHDRLPELKAMMALAEVDVMVSRFAKRNQIIVIGKKARDMMDAMTGKSVGDGR